MIKEKNVLMKKDLRIVSAGFSVLTAIIAVFLTLEQSDLSLVVPDVWSKAGMCLVTWMVAHAVSVIAEVSEGVTSERLRVLAVLLFVLGYVLFALSWRVLQPEEDIAGAIMSTSFLAGALRIWAEGISFNEEVREFKLQLQH